MQLLLDADHNAALGRTVHLRQNDARKIRRRIKQFRLPQGFFPQRQAVFISFIYL